MKKKQTLILVITRRNINVNLIPPLKVIIPMLELLGDLEVYSTSKNKITKPIYQNLVRQFQSRTIVYPLEQLIHFLLTIKQSKKIRICILGDQQISWKIILQCKRKGVIVDVAGKNSHISFWTGGIHRVVDQKNIISAFMLDLGTNTQLRKILNTTISKTVQFSVMCECCQNKKLTQAYLCSVCLAVYCDKSKLKCNKCDSQFDNLQKKEEKKKDFLQ